MATETDGRKLRGVFLLLLAIAISALFFRMIQSFVLALLLAAILASLSQPMYQRILDAFKGRKSLAAGVTLLLGTVLVVAPFMGLMTVVAREATEVANSVGPWAEQQLQQSSEWKQRLESIPWVAKLAPYQDDVLAKAGQLSGKAATFAIDRLATGTRGTAKFFLLLFVMLYAIFYFLKEGRSILDRALRYVPLSAEEQGRMLKTFTTVTRATIKGTGVIGIIQGVLAGAAFAVVGITGPVFLGMVIAVLSLVPGVGPAIVWVPAVWANWIETTGWARVCLRWSVIATVICSTVMPATRTLP